MLHLMSELVGLNRGRLVLLDEHERATEGPIDPFSRARIRYAYGLTRTEMEHGVYAQGEGITGAVLATGHPMIVQDIDHEPRFLQRAVARASLPQETVAFLAVPVEVDGRCVGVMACHRIRSRHRALTDDLALLKLLATLAGQVLQLSMLVRRKTAALEAQNALLKGVLQSAAMRYGIVGQSPALLKSLHELERVSQSQATVMLLGESGTGKELFARAVHLSSPRHERPFIKVNCAAIPETLFESELFGHERGAFTGAAAARAGLFERANGGTLFLDEVGELPLALQSKLLRTLQDGTLTRLGGSREVHVDVRMVVATHRNLVNDVAMGRFRRDLYYRLNVVPIRLPALRERCEDIKPLALHFLSRANQAHQRNMHFSEGAWRWLSEQPWPGNIRELGNLVERAVLLGTGPVVEALELQQLAQWAPGLAEELGDAPAPNSAAQPAVSTPLAAPRPSPGSELAVRDYRSVRSHTATILREALNAAGGNQSRAAQALGLTPRQFAYRWKRLEQGNAAGGATD
jgi:Nif-specific regulatory protein